MCPSKHCQTENLILDGRDGYFLEKTGCVKSNIIRLTIHEKKDLLTMNDDLGLCFTKLQQLYFVQFTFCVPKNIIVSQNYILSFIE